MALYFSIFERGSATASIQLPHEYGAQWKGALQESISEASWMLWRRITQYRAGSSNTTSMSICRSSKISGSFKGTACFTSPRPPGRGVDMFWNTRCASVTTELSNAPTSWTCDSIAPRLKTVPFGSAGTLDWVRPFQSNPVDAEEAANVSRAVGGGTNPSSQ